MAGVTAATSPAAKDHRKSINVRQSFKDWRRFSSALQIETERSIKSSAFFSARAQNLAIEQSLYQAIFSSNVYIVPIDKSVADEKAELKKKLVVRFVDTELASSSVKGALFIHELEITNKRDTMMPKKDIVIIHGYMAALGYFLKNMEQLADSYPNLVVHVIDLPGFGNSARPKFPKELVKRLSSAPDLDQINQAIEVENWFIDKLEEWRIEKGIEHFDLIAHSMGAYISSCYLMKYNKNIDRSMMVEKFALVSPMGTEPSQVSLISGGKFQFDHNEVNNNPLREILATQDFEHDGENQETVKTWQKLGKPRFPNSIFLRTLWENNISPFQILQWLGPFYSKILSFWSFRRFGGLQSSYCDDSGDNTELILKLHDYSFSIFNQYLASGELAITKMINHEILPLLPLSDRGFVEFVSQSGIQTLWLYGENDWMNSKGGQYCVKKIDNLGKTSAKFKKVEKAGHHLYLDNPEAFNQAIVEFFGYSNK